MSVIVLLIAAGGVVAAGFLAAFAWAVNSGQFDDTTTPAVRVLQETQSPDPGPDPGPNRLRHGYGESAEAFAKAEGPGLRNFSSIKGAD